MSNSASAFPKYTVTLGAASRTGAVAGAERSVGVSPTGSVRGAPSVGSAALLGPPYRASGAVTDAPEVVAGEGTFVLPMTTREGFTVDAEFTAPTGFGKQFQNQNEVSAYVELRVGDVSHTGMVFEGGGSGRGCMLFQYNGRFYWQSGNGGDAAGNDNGAVEVSAPIPEPGDYIVEVSSSVAQDLGAIYLNGVRQDVNGPPSLENAAGSNGGNFDQTPNSSYRNNVAGIGEGSPAYSDGVGNEVLSTLRIFQGESYVGE